jgi:ribonuclease D
LHREQPYKLITDPDDLIGQLDALRLALGADPRLAIDTEFVRERTYVPLLEVVQLRAASGPALILDAAALASKPDGLAPLVELLVDPGILKLFHAFSQDLEILKLVLGCEVGPVWDTQIGGAFAGLGAQVGYAGLVQAVLGERVAKGESMADWSARPLSASMLMYAAEDVRWLHALHEVIIAKLDNMGRLGWAEDQIERAAKNALDILPQERLWQQVGGRGSMDARQLTVLQALALWRDAEAERINKPRRTVLKDEVLVELVKRRPKSAADVLALRRIARNINELWAGQIVQVISDAQRAPIIDIPPSDGPAMDEAGEQLLDLLNTVLKVLARQHDLPASLLATQSELRGFVQRRHAPAPDEPLMTGWRGELLRERFEAVMRGELAVRWDSAQHNLRVDG